MIFRVIFSISLSSEVQLLFVRVNLVLSVIRLVKRVCDVLKVDLSITCDILRFMMRILMDIRWKTILNCNFIVQFIIWVVFGVGQRVCFSHWSCSLENSFWYYLWLRLFIHNWCILNSITSSILVSVVDLVVINMLKFGIFILIKHTHHTLMDISAIQMIFTFLINSNKLVVNLCLFVHLTVTQFTSR